MDSSLLDENENDPFKTLPPHMVVTSTPSKKTPPQLICPYCNKTYQKNHYYLKHIRDVHGDQVPSANLNVSLAVHLDPNDVSFSLMGPQQDIPQPVFQVPKVPVQSNKRKKPSLKPQLICTYCLKAYVDSRSYKNHMRGHTMQAASTHLPKTEKIMESSEDIGDRALTHVSNSPSEGQSGLKFKELFGHIAGIAHGPNWAMFCRTVCNEFLQGIANKKVLLPSALATSLLQQVEQTLSNPDLCDKIIDKLELPKHFSSDNIAQFFLEFSLNFASEIMKFISKTFRDNVPKRLRQSITKEPDKEERQVIYYIAGSVMRGYLKIAKRSPKSVTWQNVASVIKNKILVDKASGDLDEDSEWTSDVDRGGLLYINIPTQNFFVPLTTVVYQSEKTNGSIDYDDVIKEVVNPPLSVKWDEIISGSLPENVSVNLLSDVVSCYCKACGRGFAMRRLNRLRAKPMVSMPTRHLVASRKNRK